MATRKTRKKTGSSYATFTQNTQAGKAYRGRVYKEVKTYHGRGEPDLTNIGGAVRKKESIPPKSTANQPTRKQKARTARRSNFEV